jgi:diketogulonate reductase-like aldo/keto reductase
MLGFGTYKLQDPLIIKSACDAGYTVFNTAELYKNERIIADVIRMDKYSSKIITKISFNSIKNNRIEKSFHKRLEIFDKIHIHAILLHQPYKNCRESWDELVNLYLKNKTKLSYIGVSNYNVDQLKMLEGSPIKPKYNEIEINPFCNNSQKILDYCKENDIEIIAHTPLAKGEKLHDHRLMAIADMLSITTAQLLIKWSLQNGYLCIPKADTEKHVFENAAVMLLPDLPKYVMEYLNSINEDYYLTKIPI